MSVSMPSVGPGEKRAQGVAFRRWMREAKFEHASQSQINIAQLDFVRGWAAARAWIRVHERRRKS